MFCTNTRHLGRKPHFKDCTLILTVFTQASLQLILTRMDLNWSLTLNTKDHATTFQRWSNLEGFGFVLMEELNQRSEEETDESITAAAVKVN